MRITDEMLAQYLSNRALIKELEDINETIAIGIKACGGVQTENYVASVEDSVRRGVASKGEFDERMGQGWLEKNGLLVHHTFKKITVIARPGKKAGAL